MKLEAEIWYTYVILGVEFNENKNLTQNPSHVVMAPLGYCSLLIRVISSWN